MDTSARTDHFLRYLRRLQYLLLTGFLPMILYLGLTAWDREEHFVTLRTALLMLSPAILALGALGLQLSLRGLRYSLKDPAVQAIIRDESRRLHFDGALRVAFLVVVVTQLPLAWLLSLRPGPDSLYHLATLTFFLGFIAWLAAFLILDRD
jgi:hypothetical protein